MGVMIKVIYWLLIVIIIYTTYSLALVKFTIPKTDVIHPKSGLILHYISEYRPANKILTFSVSLPMYSDMCFLIPNEAMGKIPDCEDKEAMVRLIKETQRELQKKNNTRIQLGATQEEITRKVVSETQTTQSMKKSKKAAKSTTKSASTVNQMRKSTSIVNLTTKSASTSNPITFSRSINNPTTTPRSPNVT